MAETLQHAAPAPKVALITGVTGQDGLGSLRILEAIRMPGPLRDASKARLQLGWSPPTRRPERVREMVAADHQAARKDSLVREAGFPSFPRHEH